MAEANPLQRRRGLSAAPCPAPMRRRPAPGILRGNPLIVSVVPLSGAERMALMRQRKAMGVTCSPACLSCGKTFRLAAASFQRLQAGLCSSCWRATPEGAEERRAGDRRRYQGSEERRAASAAAVARLRERRRAGEQAP